MRCPCDPLDQIDAQHLITKPSVARYLRGVAQLPVGPVEQTKPGIGTGGMGAPRRTASSARRSCAASGFKMAG